jgi:hypothetical protein
MIYPASIWLLPDAHPGLESQIDAFRGDGFNHELYRGILSREVIRIMLDDVFCDIVADPDMAERVLRWMQVAVRSTPENEIRWQMIAG